MKFDELNQKLIQEYGSEILQRMTGPKLQELLYNLIIDKKPKNCLELGSGYGVSSCFIGAALDEIGNGNLITIDRRAVLEKAPPIIYEVIKKIGLSDYITPILADTSYNWELMKLIEKNTTKDVCSPIFDFCLIDGAHTWETDGLAFFLITKILKSGGWLVLDDIYWTYAKSPTLKNKPFVQYLPDDQKTTPQLKGVFDLLIRQSPLYRDCAINSGIAICQKI